LKSAIAKHETYDNPRNALEDEEMLDVKVYIYIYAFLVEQ
jgi:hypothetical protein